MKLMWNAPRIFFEEGDEPLPTGSPNVIGEGSGQGTTDLDNVPWDWETWAVLAYDAGLDVDGDGEIATYDDYVLWMQNHGYEDDITPAP